MGSVTAVVEISSDDEDGWRTPGAGKRKSTVGGLVTPGADNHPPDGGWRTPGDGKKMSSDNGLEWAEKLLDEDCDALEDGFDDSPEMRELWASLIDDDTSILVDTKKSSVDEPEKKNLHDADEDDDDCVILDGDPEKAVAVAKEEGPWRDSAEDELQIVAEKGELACRDFPHPRHLCISFSFSTSSHASHCTMCHCYICDSPAPCAFWGNGYGINDHCHSTDKDPKWNELRQLFKHKSEQAPKLGGVQNLHQSSSTTSANLMVPSNTVSQIQQMHPSVMVSQNMGRGIFRPRAPSPWRRTTAPSNMSKRARVAPPVSTPSNVNYVQHSVPRCSPMQPVFPRGFQTAQAPQGDTYVSLPYLSPPSAPLPLRAPNGSQVYQRQASPHSLGPHTVVGTGVPLSRCTSLSTQGRQQPQGPSTDTTRTLRAALTNLANELGVPDYNIDPPVGQQSASSASQTLYPNQVLGAKDSRGCEINPNYGVGQAPVPQRISLSSRHNSSNRTAGSPVISSDAIQTKQPLFQLNSQSNLVPNETTPSIVIRFLSRNVNGTLSPGCSKN